MPFIPEDTYTALECLNLAPDWDSAVSTALSQLEERSESFVLEVQQILVQVAQVNATFLVETGSTNFALMQADVLRYEQNQRIVGMLIQKIGLVKRLALLLSIEPDTNYLEQMLRMLGVQHTSFINPNAKLKRS